MELALQRTELEPISPRRPPSAFEAVPSPPELSDELQMTLTSKSGSGSLCCNSASLRRTRKFESSFCGNLVKFEVSITKVSILRLRWPRNFTNLVVNEGLKSGDDTPARSYRNLDLQ